jgi:hypothetical protein
VYKLPRGFFISRYFLDIEPGGLALDQRGHGSAHEQFGDIGIPRDGGLADLLAGQIVPSGYYHLDRMLTGIAHHGSKIGCCGTCLDARGIRDEMPVGAAARSALGELADWILDADKDTASFSMWAVVAESSEPGQLVCDPMCGVGTPLIEAARLGRRAFGLTCDTVGGPKRRQHAEPGFRGAGRSWAWRVR